jgi:putative photosynthetic complex assembly protein
MSSIQDAHGPSGGRPSPGARRRIVNTRSDQVETVPRVILRAIGALVVLSVVLVAWARLSGMEPAASPPDRAVRAEASIVIEAEGLARVTVLNAETGAIVAELSETEGGFIAGVQRAYARQRMLAGLPEDAPVRLVRWEDDRMSLIDPATGWRAELHGFGRDNTEAFARLLD